jgi:hypothetical protein
VTVCVPCHEAGKVNVPAMRFIPLSGATVPMCEACWGGGMGPGMSWKPAGKPHVQDVAPRVQSPTVEELMKKKGWLKSIAEAAERDVPDKSTQVITRRPAGGFNSGKESNKERNRKMQIDRDAGMSLGEIAGKYKLSLGTAAAYTKSPKSKAPAVHLPARSVTARKPLRGTDFDALLALLELKKVKIDKAIEAVRVVQRLMDEG